MQTFFKATATGGCFLGNNVTRESCQKEGREDGGRKVGLREEKLPPNRFVDVHL